MFGPPPSDVLAPVIGARLDRADVQWHVVPGQEDSLIRFWLRFGTDTFGFHVGADGEVLDVIAESCWADEDLGGYGRLEVRPATGTDPPALAVGQRLVAVDDLFDDEAASTIGARLRFESVAVSVADWEDELHWANGDLPPTVAARPR